MAVPLPHRSTEPARTHPTHWLISAGAYDENGEWQGEQKEYKEVEKIVHKEVIKEVTVGVSEEELSKVRARAEIDR